MTDLETKALRFANLDRLRREIKASLKGTARSLPCLSPEERDQYDNNYYHGEDAWCHRQLSDKGYYEPDLKGPDEWCANCRKRWDLRRYVAMLATKRGGALRALKNEVFRRIGRPRRNGGGRERRT